MASAPTISLSVLCPSGHTVTAKVSPNDPLLTVLESVCRKRGLDPQRHFLRHHKTRLDNSNLVRYANLPNHGKLELVEMSEEEVASAAAAGARASVTICVQLKDGGRVQGDFHPDTSLLDLLGTLEQQGKLSLKLAKEGEEPILVHVAREVVGREALAKTTIRSLGFPAGGRELLRLIFRDPREEKILTSTFNPASQSSGSRPRAESPVRRPMRVDDGTSMLQKLTQNETKPKPEEAWVEGKKEEEEEEQEVAMEQDSDHHPVNQTPRETKADTAKSEAMEQQAVEEEPTAAPEEEILHYVDEENKVVVFRLGESAGAASAARNVDDSFFELSIDEVKRLYAEQVSETKKLTEGEALVTKGHREAQKEAQKMQTLNKYRKTVVRVQFPDRWVLQARFKSWQSVADVEELVAGYLADPDCQFQLFTTPPKVVLDSKTKLIDCNCVPSVVMHFPSSDKKPVAGYLKPEVMAKESNSAGAARAAREADVVRPVKKMEGESMEESGSQPKKGKQ